MDELTTAEQAQAELAGRVLRWLAIFGLVIGGVDLLALAGQMLLQRWQLWMPFSNWNAAEHTLIALYFSSPVLLVVGSAGLWRHRSWARPVLFCYIAVQVAGRALSAGFVVVWYWNVHQADATQIRLQDVLGIGLQVAHNAWASSLFALVLLVFLWLMKLPALARRPSGGFEPIMRP